MKYDCTYYWNGGTEVGKWIRADVGKREELRLMGYVAHNGQSNIGAPEGPPTLEEINEVLHPAINRARFTNDLVASWKKSGEAK